MLLQFLIRGLNPKEILQSLQTRSLGFRMQSLTFSQSLSGFPVTVTVTKLPVAGPNAALRLAPNFNCYSLHTDSLVVTDPITFAEAAKKGNVIPLHTKLFQDQLTPVVGYRCLVGEEDREAPSFLFESIEPGAKASKVGRFSMVGAHPVMEVVAKENKVSIMDHEKETLTEKIVEDPMVIPRRISESWKPQPLADLPDTFCGGWVGYFSYDTVRYRENGKLPFSSAPEDDRNLPDIHLCLYEDVIVFDNLLKKIHVIHWVRLDRYSSVDDAYLQGTKKLERLLARILDAERPRLSPGTLELKDHHFGTSLKKSNMSPEEFKDAVLLAKEHIAAGHIFQVVLSQRFEHRTFADPFEVYRALRVVNPSPYMGYLQARGCILVASSPEILTCMKEGKIVNRPLAGTARRGRTSEEDEMLEEQLLKDPKQCAEHTMLVDLGRSDIGKVSKYGSVKVEKLMNIERYSHVMHISSTVTGELHDNLTCWDALSASMPVGNVTGTPKLKAMELLDKLEVTKRGPYSGGFGGISFLGEMNIALALRTIVFPTRPSNNTMYSYKNSKIRREWIAHLQVGAGIVADSQPDDEYLETQTKAVALAGAIDLAESTFVNNES